MPAIRLIVIAAGLLAASPVLAQVGTGTPVDWSTQSVPGVGTPVAASSDHSAPPRKSAPAYKNVKPCPQAKSPKSARNIRWAPAKRERC